jgi:LacI family transcriptional regulator
MARAPATITDVAAAAGVSIRTVSRVLNDSPKVGTDTRLAIKTVIEQLGFHPSSRARGMATGRSYLIGVIQDDPNAHVIGVLQRGIAGLCAQEGYELVVHPTRYDDPGLVANVRDFVGRSRVDGVLLLPPVSERADVAAALAALGVPAIALAAVPVPGHPAMLISDERGAAAMLADHLVALGHIRIAMITGPRHFRSSSEREGGFRTALARAGVALPDAMLCEGDYGFTSGLAAARTLLAVHERPTAIFAANDIMAAAALKAAGEVGLAVPRDLSVAGFDDTDIATMLTPTLTTIRRPLERNAAEATRQLFALIGGEPASENDPVALMLMVRDSTGPAPAA